jgi:hypothetical protein
MSPSGLRSSLKRSRRLSSRSCDSSSSTDQSRSVLRHRKVAAADQIYVTRSALMPAPHLHLHFIERSLQQQPARCRSLSRDPSRSPRMSSSNSANPRRLSGVYIHQLPNHQTLLPPGQQRGIHNRCSNHQCYAIASGAAIRHLPINPQTQ